MELLKGKTAMVTGGTRGIGYAIVKMYLDNGAKVALFGSRQETVDKALDKLRAENPDYKVIGLCPDLQDPAEVEKAVAAVKETFGSLDIMVNNAGVSARESIYDYKPEDFAKTMALNVNAVFNCAQAAAKVMRERRHPEHQLHGQHLRTALRRGLSRFQVRRQRPDQVPGQGAGQGQHPRERRGAGRHQDGHGGSAA